MAFDITLLGSDAWHISRGWFQPFVGSELSWAINLLEILLTKFELAVKWNHDLLPYA
jgi:hypothetical protein